MVGEGWRGGDAKLGRWRRVGRGGDAIWCVTTKFEASILKLFFPLGDKLTLGCIVGP